MMLFFLHYCSSQQQQQQTFHCVSLTLMYMYIKTDLL